MKNKLNKGLSLSVNPKHSISECFKASTRGFCHFWEKFKGKWNTPLIVILGFIPRIHAKQNLSRHYRACPDNLDTRVKPEDDNRRRMSFKPEYDSRKRMCFNPENDHNNLIDKSVFLISVMFIFLIKYQIL